MKVYIASKYIKNKGINRKISRFLSEHGIDVFLPETIPLESTTPENMRNIAVKCYDEIESSDVMLVISPFGRSVSAEIGYAVYKKRHQKDIDIILVRYKDDDMEIEDSEVMIYPFYQSIVDICDYEIDTNTGDLDEKLTELLNHICSA